MGTELPRPNSLAVQHKNQTRLIYNYDDLALGAVQLDLCVRCGTITTEIARNGITLRQFQPCCPHSAHLEVVILRTTCGFWLICLPPTSNSEFAVAPGIPICTWDS